MAVSEDYMVRIGSLDWEGLQSLWEAIRACQTPDWPPGKALEYLVVRAFELDGAEVAWPFEVKIGEETVEQIDGVVYCDGLSCLIECKDRATPVNVEPIAKLRNQLLRRPSGVLGMIVSRSGFSEAARSLAQFLAPQTILLWEGEEIGIVLQRQAIRGALQRKYRYAVERGAPDYNLRNEKIP